MSSSNIVPFARRPGKPKLTVLLREMHAAFAIAMGGGALLLAGLAHATDTPPDAVPGVTGGAEDGADTSSEAAAASLQVIKVTAQKREGKAQEVPSAITVLGGTQLLENGIGRSASEILNYVPNASAGTQQHGRPRWWIRGVGAGQQQIDFPNPVGFYLDDVYISNSTATGFPLFDVERVEVLRGPQGTLWGKNTTGGAINIISRKPREYLDGYIKADYSSNETRLIEGAIGGALKDDVLAGRLSFHSEDQGEGPLNNLYTGKKDGKLRDNAVRGQLQAKLSRDLTANLNLHYRDYRTTGAITTTGSYAANGVYRNGYIPSNDSEDVSTNAPTLTAIKQGGANLNIQYDLGGYTLTSITGYEDFKTDTLGDSDNTPLEVSRGWSKASSHQFSQELRLATAKDEKVSWVGGLHYFNEGIRSSSATARLPNDIAGALAGSTQPVGYNATAFTHDTRSFALFGSTTVNFTERFLATAGLRWTTETKDLDLRRIQAASGTVTFGSAANWWNTVQGGNFTAASVANNNFTSRPSTTWRAWTYDFTPEYKITDQARAYFKYAHGIKSGGYNTGASDVRALNTVAPEKLDSVELGLKSEWLDRRLNFNASVFHYDYKNVQVNITGVYNGDPTQSVAYLQNVSKAHVNGAEFEIEALPFDQLHINANVGILRTEFDQFDIQNNGGNRNGNEFVRSPHLTALLAADYRIPLANGGKIVLSGDVRYTSKQFYYVDPQNTARYLLNQPGYSLINARASYTLPGGNHIFTLYSSDLGDKVFKNHTLTTYVPGTTNGDTIYWGARRTIGGSYTYYF
ncbi:MULTISPECIES: TonB-dependent receptor [unclassified Duganella]|uniref:TonB-dependent receptor n=1 Tax=unclassified Duganella TaxID=2636909 RepID=UPI000881BF01|nr:MULTISPECIES: TonB-dependent receptor [unclassified Duganella]SDG53720.1 iron complex outermembrane recepter protein [Duganella sp. OV458]SDJ76453.1 iron complex outermembrane recepter protein [Duganella sp. OV510]